MPILASIDDEAHRILDQAGRENLHLRLIGGLAVKLHSPVMDQFNLRRDYPDIDLVASRKEQRRLADFFEDMGYQPDREFNALNGGRRQIYYDPQNARHIDVFIGDFQMCHRLPMKDRLGLHPMTVPLAELFLSKSQIVQLNRKDALDLIGLLLDNELGTSDTEMINLERIARLCARDWGLYKTTELNLSRLDELLQKDDLGLTEAQTERVTQRIRAIRSALDRARKPILWKARNRVGTRFRWYTEVEEVNQGNG